MALASGTRLGPYEIVAPLGAGGMGEVYRARDTRLERDVAIKVLPDAFARDAERLRRFENEARTIATLNHPNILSIYDVGTLDRTPYLVSELLEGHSLRQELGGGAIPLRRAVEYGIQIAQGLAAAHDKGIIHRDLKPENVFVTPDGRLKILDFGLAKLAKLGASPDEGATLEAAVRETSPGMVLGTVGYMSPEQVKGEAADARADIFALGTILYEMLSGQRAFRRDTSAETMTAILKEDPAELSASSKSIAPALERIVRRCIEKKPLQRFQSARDLAFDLEAFSGISSTSAASVTAARWMQRKWLIPFVVGLLLLVAGGVGDWVYRRGASTTAPPSYQQLTFERGLIYAARFARDGRSIYYSAGWNGQPVQLYSTAPDSPESRPLNLINSTLFGVSSSEMAISLGCKDLFIGDCQGTLALVPVSGGAPREIVEGVLSADWTNDGSELAVIRQVAGKYRVEFPRGNVIYESTHWLDYLRIAPRAGVVAFAEFAGTGGDGGWVIVLDRQGKEIARSVTFVSVEGLAWPPSGEEVWIGATSAGWADSIQALRFNGTQRIVLRVPGNLRLHDVSSDGRILFSTESWRSELQFRGPGVSKERDLSWLDYAEVTDLLADGAQVAFDDWGSAAGASSLAYWRRTDGSPALKLGAWGRPILSPDGKRVLAVEGTIMGLARLALVPTGAGEVQRLNMTGIQQYASYGWMPDGKQIYFTADDGRGWRVYVQDLAGGAPRGVTPLVSVNPSYFESRLVSPDGRFVFVRDLGGRAGLYPLAGGEFQAFPGWLPEDIWITWSTDGRSAYAYQDKKNSAPVYRLDVATGRRQLVATLAVSDSAGVTAMANVRMTPDGKSYAYSYHRELSDLFLVEGVR
jgi:eukaryotic-like serine/threonine-protein kinase